MPQRGFNLPGPLVERIRGSGLGFYSFLYRYMYDGPGPLHLGRLEHLATDLERMLEAVGQPVSAAMRSYIESERPRNASGHGDYAAYYDGELRAHVEERDALVVDRHGYRFGD